MKKLFIPLSIFILSIPGFAATRKISNPHLVESHYSQLLKYFYEGRAPTQIEIQGIWSGRCYGILAQDVATGGGLIARKVGSRPIDNGPIFPDQGSTATFNLVLWYPKDDNLKPERFDNLSMNDRSAIEDYLSGDQFPKMISIVKNGSMRVQFKGGNIKYQIRKYQKYFIAKTSAMRTNGNFKAGEVIDVCYYFKKISELK